MAKRSSQIKPMDDEKLSAVMKALIEDAEDYAEELGDMREQTNHAYRGSEYGNEEEGRSQIVTRDVRDAVQTAMPSIMRVLFGSHQIVEFAGHDEDDVLPARDATAYVMDAIHNVNPGYTEFQSAIEDALVRMTGVFKVWWETSEKPKETEVTGVTAQELEIIAADPEVESVEAEENGEFMPAYVDPDGEPMEPEPLYDATILRIETKGRLRFQAVPPEEFIINRKARSVEAARLAGHRRNATISELVELGYPLEEIEDLSGTEEDFDAEKESRSIGTTEDLEIDDSADPSQREIYYAECWVRVDYDGDGIAELRRVCVAGAELRILENELADETMLATLCPSPVAHQAIGESLAGLIEDIQKIKTIILRNVLDSLAQAIHPDTIGVENQVNFDDLLNTEIGRVIRAKAPGMVEYKAMPFVGKEAFPVMQYMDTLSQARTGLNEASEGLNADALQSTSTSAIDNATQSAQARIEYITRTFIETGIKRLFKLMLKTSIENADRATKIRLNNRFLEVDPRSWNAEMDVTVTVALGSGSVEQRLALLNALATKQEMIIQMAGPDNPLAGIEEYRHTLAEISRLGGIVDVTRFLKDPTDPNNQPPPPEPPAPDPQLILAEAEAERTNHVNQMEELKFQLDVWKAIQEDDRARDKQIADVMIKAEQLKADGVKVDMAAIKTAIDHEREQHDFMVKLMHEGNAAKAAEMRRQQQQQGSPVQGVQQQMNQGG